MQVPSLIKDGQSSENMERCWNMGRAIAIAVVILEAAILCLSQREREIPMLT